MAEFKEVMKQFKRMCDGRTWCDSCQICDNRGLISCSRWLTENPTKAEEIIMEWAKKNPPVTNRDKFKEVFGFDPFTDKHLMCGTPIIGWFGKEYKEPKDE